MRIFVNGREIEIEMSCTISGLLSQMGYHDYFVAVARNQVHITRANFATTLVQADDHIEILAPMAGG